MSSLVHCPVAVLCGGCPVIGQTREQQQLQKQAAVLSRLASVGVTPPTPRWVPSPEVHGYRNRVRFAFAEGLPRFFNPNKDEQCAVLEPALRSCLAEFRVWASQHSRLLRGCAHAELRVPDLDGRWALALTPLPDTKGLLQLEQQLQQALPEALLWLRGASVPPAQRVALCGDIYGYVPLGSFRQVNSPVNTALLQTLVSIAQDVRASSFCDLYSGAGNFGLPLLAAGLMGLGVETDEHAVAALQRSAREQGFDASGFVAGDAELTTTQWLAAGYAPELVIVDPPRAGLKSAAQVVTRLAREQLVLVSCVMDSFARDVATLYEHGFSLVELWLADMFPQTAHVEVLVRLERRSRR
jgi:23S rRNA (uracil1939-C5)-methyltransferase